jgi:hypothetical protein
MMIPILLMLVVERFYPFPGNIFHLALHFHFECNIHHQAFDVRAVLQHTLLVVAREVLFKHAWLATVLRGMCNCPRSSLRATSTWCGAL